MNHVYARIDLPDGKRLLFHDDGSYLRSDLQQRQITEIAIDRRRGRASVPSSYRVRAARPLVA